MTIEGVIKGGSDNNIILIFYKVAYFFSFGTFFEFLNKNYSKYLHVKKRSTTFALVKRQRSQKFFSSSVG